MAKKPETDGENRNPDISGRVRGPLNGDGAGIGDFFGDTNGDGDGDDTHRPGPIRYIYIIPNIILYIYIYI